MTPAPSTRPSTRPPPRADLAPDLPFYNIGMVARLTGLAVATLRVWERRYRFPESDRSPGGQRLYSPGQVAELLWVKARIDEGMQTGQAIRALGHRRQPEPPVGPPAAESRVPAEAGALGPVLADRLGLALREHRLDEADVVLAEALAIIPLETVLLAILRPTLAEIGESWVRGELNVATEHLASHYIRERLLLWLSAAAAPRPVASTVLACAPGDWHEIGLLILAVLLRRRRWPIHYLGPAVPLPDLAIFCAETRPAAVVVVATTEDSALALRSWPEHLPELAAGDGPPFCFAGRAFSCDPQLRAAVPGTFLGETIEASLEALERLLRDITGELH